MVAVCEAQSANPSLRNLLLIERVENTRTKSVLPSSVASRHALQTLYRSTTYYKPRLLSLKIIMIGNEKNTLDRVSRVGFAPWKPTSLIPLASTTIY